MLYTLTIIFCIVIGMIFHIIITKTKIIKNLNTITQSKDKDFTPLIKLESKQGLINKLRKSDPFKFDDCLWDNICPLCGKNMELHMYGCFDQFSDHWCTHCGFSTKMELLV